MWRNIRMLFSLFLLVTIINSSAQTTITVFDKILFYDGYAATVTFPVPAGIIRHRNNLFAKKLTAQQLQLLQNTLTMKITIKAACDNYDRIGNANLAFVPKGSTAYKPDSVNRIEIGRFITPFMNKNIKPDTVPYVFEINNVVPILKDTTILNKYDIWVELDIFGVPYAAQTQVAGCSGRTDVFYGTLNLITTSKGQQEDFNLLVPMAIRTSFNNYTAGATDTLGKTTKTFNFVLQSNATNAKLTLITSNHGSNSGGEEYNRRNHYVYLDGVLKHTYKPGRQTCEPFRVFNTQANGIYGSTPKTDAQWQSFSNWCPGDVISTRTIELGSLTKGMHKVTIRVPDAKFVDKQGEFPLSMYLQAQTSGTIIVKGLEQGNCSIHPFGQYTHGILTIRSVGTIKRVTIFDQKGQKIHCGAGNQIDISGYRSGVYFVKLKFEGTEQAVLRVIKN